MGMQAEYNKYMDQLRQHELEQRKMQAEAMRNNYAQQQMQYAQQQANSLYGPAQQGQIVNSVLAQQYAAAQQAMVEDFNPNDHEAWTMPMSALVNLWRAKFLDEWIVFRMSKHEPFWQQAYTRLNDASMFERAPGQWIRLREGA